MQATLLPVSEAEAVFLFATLITVAKVFKGFRHFRTVLVAATLTFAKGFVARDASLVANTIIVLATGFLAGTEKSPWFFQFIL